MTTFAVLAIEAGETLSLRDILDIAEKAAHHGVTVRILDAAESLDPTTVASYVAGIFPAASWLVDVPTTRNAPYNLARRVLSLDRATVGRSGVVLRAGHGDEVSDAATPDPSATSQPARWAEYAQILTRLWESFPREALLGDQSAGIFVDDSLISTIDHEGAFYRVRGPLDGPSSVQGRPVLVADDLDVLSWDAVAAVADVAVVRDDRVAGAATALTSALERAGRARDTVALVGRAPAGVLGDELVFWAGANELDGVEVVATSRDEALRIVGDGLSFTRPSGGTLRDAFGLLQLAVTRP